MGGDYLFTEDMSELNVGSQAVKNAIQHFVAFQSGETKSAEAVSAGGSTSGGEKFKNGDVSVVWNGRWAFQSYDWYDVNFDIGIAPPPTPNGGEDIYCATSMIAHAISATSAHPEVAYAFLDYYMTAGMKEYVKTGYNIPAGYGFATHFYNIENSLVPSEAKTLCTIHDYIVMKLCSNKKPDFHHCNTRQKNEMDNTVI